MPLEGKSDLQAVLDGLGQGILIFSSDGKLVMDNRAARGILGTDIALIKAEGWSAAATLFNSKQTSPEQSLDALRAQVLSAERPVRFHTFRSGEYLPCWAAALQAEDGGVYIMLTLDSTDWSAMTNLLERFRAEMRDAIQSTQGHIDLIRQTMNVYKPDGTVEGLKRPIANFSTLIAVHMDRVGRFLAMLERLEDLRTGRLRTEARDRRKKIILGDFFEDLAETLDDLPLVDPETDAHDHRSRLALNIEDGLAVNTAAFYLTRILHDVLRNAIMYSMKATPITIRAARRPQGVQIDVIDEGYGIREKERERVFEPFARARQPQIISEFGYGLSLYLCKHEVEAMNGRMWFDSTESVGTTISLMLPAWEAPSSDSPSSSSDREPSAP
jgi:signal transduction histidine kinase